MMSGRVGGVRRAALFYDVGSSGRCEEVAKMLYIRKVLTLSFIELCMMTLAQYGGDTDSVQGA